jgi:hypothetical protein
MRNLATVFALVLSSYGFSQMVVGSSAKQEPIGYEIDSEEDIATYQEELKRDSIAKSHKQTQKSPFTSKYSTRKIIKRPMLSNDFHSDEDCTITLTFYVNAEGSICSNPVVITNQTTTDNIQMVNEVIKVVLRDTKYSKGTTKELAKLTLRIQAD